MAFPPSDKTMEGVIRDTRDRLDLVERRLAFGGSAGDTEPATIHVAGEVWQVPSGVAPPDTLLCDGRAVSRTTYAELFAKIGTTYGGGDGSTTFNLPLLNGKKTIVNGPQGVVDGIFPPIGNQAQFHPDAWDIFYSLDNSAAGGANSELRMQFRAGGVNLAANSYVFARDGMSSSNLQTIQTLTYAEPGWGTAQAIAGRIRVSSAGMAGRWTDFESVSGMRSPSLAGEVLQMAGSFKDAAAINGIALYAIAGTLTGWIEAIPIGGSSVPSVIATKDITSGLVGTGTTSGGAAGAALPAGAVVAWDSNTIPTGFLLCDGSLHLRAAYPALFAAVGTTHSAGDGSTTFGVPDYRGRTLVGRDPAQAEFDVLGETGGAKTHTLTVAEMPNHTHGAFQRTSGAGGDTSGTGVPPHNGLATGGATNTSPTGNGAAHNNLQPYAVANYIISTGAGLSGGGGPGEPGHSMRHLGHVSSLVTASGIGTTAVQVPGISLPISMDSAGRVRIALQVNSYSAQTADAIQLRLIDGATTVAEWTVTPNSSATTAGTTRTHNVFTELDVTSGTHTYTVWVLRVVGGGAVNIAPSGPTPTLLSVDQIG